MFTALTLSLALGAPVPSAPATPVATGAAPRLMELKPDSNGKITVTVTRTEMQKVQVRAGIAIAPGGGAAPPAVITREIPVTRQMPVELSEVKDLVIATADGKKLTKEEAIKKLGTGAIVVVSTDGKPVSPVFLKVIKDDTLVLTSPELTGPQPGVFPGGRPGFRPLPPNVRPGGIQVLPAQPGIQILPAQPGGAIQLQIAPFGAAPAVLPANPAPAVPAKPAK